MTKHDFEKMSNYEINAAVAAIEYPKCIKLLRDIPSQDVVSGFDKDGMHVIVKDYCNNWADIGELIDKNDISIVKDGDYSWATDNPQELYIPVGNSAHEVKIIDGKTLRAAAIVYLLMQSEVE